MNFAYGDGHVANHVPYHVAGCNPAAHSVFQGNTLKTYVKEKATVCSSDDQVNNLMTYDEMVTTFSSDVTLVTRGGSIPTRITSFR